MGALGRGANAIDNVLPGPVQVAGGGELTGAVAILASGATALALRADGSVWGWGLADGGLLGDAGAPFRYQAEPVNGLRTIRKIVPLEGGLIALDEAGTVFYWGVAADGKTRVLPAPLAGLPRIRDIQDRGAGVTVALGFGDELIAIGGFGAVQK